MIESIVAKKRKILVVEDDKAVADYLESLLDVQGYDVQVCMNGRDAVKTAREIFPDLVLLDVMLPDINGYAVCKLIRQDPALAKTPIVMVTSLNQIGDVDNAFTAGADDYLTKPFELERLLQKVKKHLGG
jgi:DNA-binding response OmpR family regulator